jgi:hypothetical protein
MEKIEVNTAYIPLVNKLLELDDYEKIKTVVNIGFSGVDMIEKIYKHTKTHLVVNEELEVLHKQIDELHEYNRTLNQEKLKIEQEKYNEIIKLRKEIEETYSGKIDELNRELSLIQKEKSAFENDKEGEIMKIQREIEQKYVSKIEKLNNELIDTKKEHMDKMFSSAEENQRKFFKELQDMKVEKNKEVDYLKQLLEESKKGFEDTLEKELYKVEREKNKRIKELEDENNKYRNKYEKLDLKSVKKGKPYEDIIEKELIDYFKKYKTYSLERCSTIKGKGDFVVTNKYSGVRIMLEAKNMPSVSASIKDQIPKFYDNVNDKVNMYDGGIMIAIGNIETKNNYDIETLPNNKVVSFIEEYTLNNPERIYTMIELLHMKVQEIKSGKNLSKSQVLNDKIEDYKCVKNSYNKIKVVYEEQLNLMMRLKESILNLFNIDVDEYILTMNGSKKSMKESINKQISKFIEDKIKEQANIKDNKLKDLVMDKYKKYVDLYEVEKDKVNGVSKRTISSIIKKHRKNVIVI